MNHSIRLAVESDSADILSIYAPYVTDTAVSFETEVPTVSEFSRRIASITEHYPFLVYLIDKRITGYAYASKHRERAAYLYDVGVSIYVLSECHGMGIGYRLYNCLFEILKTLGYKNVYAAVTQPNERSMNLHYKCGFSLIGTHHSTGYKLEQWHDVAWLEKKINEYEKKPGNVMPINELSPRLLTSILEKNSL